MRLGVVSRRSSSWRAGFLALTACCSACAEYETRPEEPIAVGWVQSAGEVRIYPRKEDLGKLYDMVCVSGVMSNGRLMPSRFRNQHVSVYGILVDADAFYQQALNGATAGVENYCNSSKIAVITRMVKVP